MTAAVPIATLGEPKHVIRCAGDYTGLAGLELKEIWTFLRAGV